MNADELSKILAAVVPILVATIALVGSRASRNNTLKEHLELLAQLPESSPVRTKLESIVQAQLDQVANRIHHTRSYPMAIVALLLSGLGVYGALQLFTFSSILGNLGAIVVLLLSSVFMYGIFESLQNKDRRTAATP